MIDLEDTDLQTEEQEGKQMSRKSELYDRGGFSRLTDTEYVSLNGMHWSRKNAKTASRTSNYVPYNRTKS